MNKNSMLMVRKEYRNVIHFLLLQSSRSVYTLSITGVLDIFRLGYTLSRGVVSKLPYFK